MTTPRGLESWVQPRDKTEVEFTDGQVRTFKFGVKAPIDAKPQKLQVQVDWVDVVDLDQPGEPESGGGCGGGGEENRWRMDPSGRC